MMESAEDGLCHDITKAVDRARKRRVLSQSEMRPDMVVIGSISLEKLTQMDKGRPGRGRLHGHAQRRDHPWDHHSRGGEPHDPVQPDQRCAIPRRSLSDQPNSVAHKLRERRCILLSTGALGDQMTTCGKVLDDLRKMGRQWKLANSRANAQGASEKTRAALNGIEKEFVALRDSARILIRASGTLAERNRFEVLRTPRGTRVGRT